MKSLLSLIFFVLYIFASPLHQIQGKLYRPIPSFTLTLFLFSKLFFATFWNVNGVFVWFCNYCNGNLKKIKKKKFCNKRFLLLTSKVESLGSVSVKFFFLCYFHGKTSELAARFWFINRTHFISNNCLNDEMFFSFWITIKCIK